MTGHRQPAAITGAMCIPIAASCGCPSPAHFRSWTRRGAAGDAARSVAHQKPGQRWPRACGEALAKCAGPHLTGDVPAVADWLGTAETETLPAVSDRRTNVLPCEAGRPCRHSKSSGLLYRRTMVGSGRRLRWPRVWLLPHPGPDMKQRPRTLGSAKHPPLDLAPGSYV